MGYSKSIRAVRRVEPILKQLVAGQGTLEWPSDNPSEDAYQIRDGCKAAAERAIVNGEPNEPYYSYAKLPSKYIIKTSRGKVSAVLRDVVSVSALANAHTSMNIPDVDDDLAVIGAAITHKAPRMFFPDVDPNNIDLYSIWSWASESGYFLMIKEDGLTLTNYDTGKSWMPEHDA